MTKYCTHESISRELGKVFDAEDPSAEDFATATREGRELAGRAWVDNDPESLDLAERLLYRMNLASSFAPPVQAIPSLMWGILSRQKLRKVLNYDAAPKQVSQGELKERLMASQADHGSSRHPALDGFLSQESVAPLGILLKNLFVPGENFTVYTAALLQRAKFMPCRVACVGNFEDETRTGTPHDVQRKRLVTDGLGVPYEPQAFLDDPNCTREAFAMANNLTALMALASPAAGLGALGAIEENWHRETARFYKYCEQKGLSEFNTEYLSAHAELDVHHAEEWREALVTSPFTPEERALIFKGAEVANISQWDNTTSVATLLNIS